MSNEKDADQPRESKIDVHRVAYATVGGGETKGRIRRSTRLVEAENVPPAFENYVDVVATEQNTTCVEHGAYDSDTAMNTRIQKLHATADDDVLQQGTTELATQLSKEMSSNANKGTLFVAQATLTGEYVREPPADVLVVLKLDAEQGERLIQSDDGLDQVSNPFPSQDHLQKGAIYPGDRVPPLSKEGDVKVYQSSPSAYFKDFFNFDSVQQSDLEGGRSAIKKAENILVEHTDRDNLKGGDFAAIRSATDDNGNLTTETYKEVLDELTNGEITDEINEEIDNDNELKNLRVRSDDLPQMFRSEYTTGGGTVSVKYPASADDYVKVEEKNGKTIIEVESQNPSTSYVDR